MYVQKENNTSYVVRPSAVDPNIQDENIQMKQGHICHVYVHMYIGFLPPGRRAA